MLCDDVSLNRELIDTNEKEDLSNYEIVEWKQISQSKLIEKELAHIIYTHNKVVNSGLPNYQGCKIPIYIPTIKRTCSIVRRVLKMKSVVPGLTAWKRSDVLSFQPWMRSGILFIETRSETRCFIHWQCAISLEVRETYLLHIC